MVDTRERMRWLVAVDARDLSHGAVALARWLSGPRAPELFGIHVMEWVPPVEESVEPGGPEPLRDMADEIMESLAAAIGAGAVEVVEEASIEEGLRKGLIRRGGDTLVLGRRAPSGGSVGAIRLGRVARRIVRNLPSPVVVVPPDYAASHGGPVVVATDLTRSCVDAVAWAARLAAAILRPLLLAYVEPPPGRRPYLRASDQPLAPGVDPFEAWARHHGVGDAERVRLSGPPSTALIEIAAERDACMLVTGSRCLDGVERLFLASLGTELAATAPLPVALVPPGDDEGSDDEGSPDVE